MYRTTLAPATDANAPDKYVTIREDADLVGLANSFDQGDIAYHHRHTAPPDPRDLVDDLDAELGELIVRLLAKDPEDRPESAQGVLDELRGFAL